MPGYRVTAGGRRWFCDAPTPAEALDLFRENLAGIEADSFTPIGQTRQTKAETRQTKSPTVPATKQTRTKRTKR